MNGPALDDMTRRSPVRGPSLLAVIAILAVLLASSCATTRPPAAQPTPPTTTGGATIAIVPAPAAMTLHPGAPFAITPQTVIEISPADDDTRRVARVLADLLGSTPTSLPQVVEIAGPGAADGSSATPGRIRLAIRPDPALGDEGYDVTIAADGVTLRAPKPAGLFYGVQTLRQLLPVVLEHEAARRGPAPLTLPASQIRDTPRFAWRGAMLDVARHFFDVADVERYIDLLALYKINHLHLHLTDDQGWRIDIPSWPNLVRHGGSTEVGGGPGGFYTGAQYARIVAYARDRFVTIVPEVDMPGHTNAALASYAALNCNGVAPPLYTGIEVGFSALCVEAENTYAFIDDVIGTIAALTPGPYFHVGGDEVKTLTAEQYRRFIERVQQIVHKHGKRMIGWDEIAAARLAPTSIVQHWRPDAPPALIAGAPTVVLSPANRTYLDMKYDASTALGLAWAGFIDVRKAYDWDPGSHVPGLAVDRVLGVEAPLWSETVANMHEVEFMAFPRIAAVAEVAWSPQARRRWDDFERRLAAQAPRWTALGINFRRLQAEPPGRAGR